MEMEVDVEFGVLFESIVFQEVLGEKKDRVASTPKENLCFCEVIVHVDLRFSNNDRCENGASVVGFGQNGRLIKFINELVFWGFKDGLTEQTLLVSVKLIFINGFLDVCIFFSLGYLVDNRQKRGQ